MSCMYLLQKYRNYGNMKFWKYRNSGIMCLCKQAIVCICLYMFTCKCAHTADLKAYWLSSLHIGNSAFGTILLVVAGTFLYLVGGSTVNRNGTFPEHDNDVNCITA